MLLTAEQKRLLEIIEAYVRQNGIAPSYDEMQQAMGLKSKSGVNRLVLGLEERGAIRRLPNRARAIEIIKHPVSSIRLVILESPYAGDVERNIAYARRCIRDALYRREAPIASHLLYTQPGVLDDDVPVERKLGIDAGLAWRAVAQASVVYTDLGISEGMKYGIAAAGSAGLPIEYRTIGVRP